MRINNSVRVLAVIGIVSQFVGCSGGTEDRWTKDRPKVVAASGTVTVNGSPVEGANVNFHPEAAGASAYAQTDANGKFQLTTYFNNDGATPGNYKVTISKKIVETVPDANPDLNPPKVVKETFIVPEKFGAPSSSDLTANVTEAGPNEFQFDLK